MLDVNQLPPHLFALEGVFLGFHGDHASKPKALVLEVDQEPLVIKLPKDLRSSLGRTLRVGDRLRCTGRSDVDFKAGVIRLKAYQVFPLPPGSPARLAATHPPSCRATRDLPAQVLICQKSGCQKRGGRQLVAALEQALQAYQLQGQVEIRYTGCQKRCAKAPTLTVMPGQHRYDDLSPADLSALIEEHFCLPRPPAKVDPAEL